MDDDLRVVFESRNRRACAERALVLEAAQIPYRIVDVPFGAVLLVTAADSARAADELRLYDEENPPRRAPTPVRIDIYDGIPGVVAYVFLVCAVAWAAGESLFGMDWLYLGRVDGALIRAGEWWRTVTAMTLHSGLSHLAGNIVFGAFFGFFAGRLLGPGVGWLAILVAGACGNALNTLLLESTHRAIGASTAVFAALGLLAGFVWRGRLLSQERWPYRVGPIVGGFALLMYTGTGDANTDVGAHLMGFLCGLAAGVALAPNRRLLSSAGLQRAAAAAAVLLVIAAWGAAWLAGHGGTLM